MTYFKFLFIHSWRFLVALALLAHFVSSFITCSNISLFFILPDVVIKLVGNKVLTSTYVPLLKLSTSNSILFVLVAYIVPFKLLVCPHTFISSLLSTLDGRKIVPVILLASISNVSPTNCQYNSE